MLHSPYILLILATLFWGGNFALGKAVSGSIPPMTLSFLRWALALVFFLPFCYQEIISYHEKIKANYKTFIYLGITGVVGFNMCVYLAVIYTTAINASMINSFAPIVITIMSIIFLKEVISKKQWLGIGISLIGVIAIIARGDWQTLLALTFNRGDLIMIIAVLLWGIYNMILKKGGKLVPPRTLLISSIVGGLLVTWPLIVYENYQYGLEWLSQLHLGHYLSLLYFGIFPTILSFQFFNKAMLEIGPSKAAVFSNLIVVFAAFFGVVFLNEQLAFAHFFGGGLIIIGVYITTSKVHSINKKIDSTH